LSAEQVYVCPVLECFEEFPTPVWHCPFCRHHWPLDHDHCANCHQDLIAAILEEQFHLEMIVAQLDEEEDNARVRLKL
jgi:hypothetical protein